MKESKLKQYKPLIIICIILVAVITVVGIIVSNQAEKRAQEEASLRAIEAESIAEALFGTQAEE